MSAFTVRILGTELRRSFTPRGSVDIMTGIWGFVRIDGKTVSGYVDAWGVFVPRGANRGLAWGIR